MFEAVTIPEELALRIERSLSLQEAMGKMGERDRAICVMLMNGWSKVDIRKRLHLKKRELRQAIDHIRLLYIKEVSP